MATHHPSHYEGAEGSDWEGLAHLMLVDQYIFSAKWILLTFFLLKVNRKTYVIYSKENEILPNWKS